MNKKKEVTTAFKMWEHMAELQSILLKMGTSYRIFVKRKINNFFSYYFR